MSSFSLPPSAFPPRIAIVGGGISGLAAAHRLTELLPEAELSLFEAADHLGGVLNTVHRDGFLIEQSADNFLVKPSAGIELCRQLGIAEDLLTTDESRRRGFVVRDGKLIPIPDGFYLMSPRKLWPLLTSPALSLAGKLRFLAEPLIPRGPAASSSHESRNLNPPADESVASFVRRRLGREAFERFVQPLVAGIYTADPEQLSMAATMPQFLEFERERGSLLRATLFPKIGTGRLPRSEHAEASDASNDEPSLPAEVASGARYGLFVAPKTGMTSLVNSLAARLPAKSIHVKSPVSHLTHNANGWRLDFPAPPPTLLMPPSAFHGLILALPAHSAGSLLESTDAELAAELAAIAYAGCAVVSLGFARNQIRHPLDGFGFVVPAVERRRLIAGSFASLKFPNRAPAGQVLIRAFIGGAMQPELLDLSDDELSRVTREELAELLQISGKPLLTNIARWPRSMPQYHVGHLARIGRIEELAGRYPNLALAGNAYRGVGIPQCIASGIAAAERIAANFAPKNPET